MVNPPASEATVKRAMPARKTRRRPNKSPLRAPRSSKPPNVSEYALSTHDRSVRLKDSAVWIFGRAMFTIVASSTTMSWASKMMASAADRRLPDFEPARRRRCEPARGRRCEPARGRRCEPDCGETALELAVDLLVVGLAFPASLVDDG